MSKLEALMREHLKKQQEARGLHAAKVKVVQDKLTQNIKATQESVAERNKASDNFHKTTKLIGREFIAALDKLHADIDAATEKKLVALPDSSGYGAELVAALNALDQAFDIERIKIEKEEADATALAAVVLPTPSAAEEAITAQADAASDGIFQVLTKAGAKAEDLKVVLGVESAAARKKARADRIKSNNGILGTIRKAVGI